MRSIVRLGVLAAALATTAVTAPAASAACSFTVLQDPLPYVAVAVCPSSGPSVQVFPYAPAPGGYVVCYMGNEPVQVWIAGTPLNIAPFDVVQALLNQTHNPGLTCTPAGL